MCVLMSLRVLFTHVEICRWSVIYLECKQTENYLTFYQYPVKGEWKLLGYQEWKINITANSMLDFTYSLLEKASDNYNYRLSSNPIKSVYQMIDILDRSYTQTKSINNFLYGHIHIFISLCIIYSMHTHIYRSISLILFLNVNFCVYF